MRPSSAYPLHSHSNTACELCMPCSYGSLEVLMIFEFLFAAITAAYKNKYEEEELPFGERSSEAAESSGAGTLGIRAINFRSLFTRSQPPAEQPASSTQDRLAVCDSGVRGIRPRGGHA